MTEPYDWESDGAFSGVTVVPDPEPPSAPGGPVSADSWGSGRTLDPFLAGGSSDEDQVPDTEEDEPLPVDSPTFSEKRNDQEPEEIEQDPQEEKQKKTLRERVADAREKVTKARGKVKEGTAKVAKRTEPARKKVSDAREEVDPRNLTSRRWSFLWATLAAWLIGPQFLIAIWDRACDLFGQETLMSGPDAMGFGVLHGPGRWFRDQVALHWEGGSMGHLLVCAAFGVVPLILMACANAWPGYGRWFLGVAILGPVVYLIGVSYAGWTLTMTDFYLVTLFGSAWYCTVWLREKKDPGLPRLLLMIPLASVVSGALLYSPGAVW